MNLKHTLASLLLLAACVPEGMGQKPPAPHGPAPPAPTAVPVEAELRPDLDLLQEARTLGRPVLIVRFGGRDVSEQELAAQAIAGTVLLPDENGLALPAARP